ncbi:MAG TPA: nuclear transport factor 2 family protein [Candidatus Binatia bacterium]|nr:nuclear transport factor 2 family protein [Candidatus Binatia bacterium]
MNRSDVQAWLDRYVEAWRANDPEPIRALFTEDAVYRYRPWDDPEQTVVGSDAIARSWLEEPDDPDAWEAHYEPYAVEGDRAVAVGFSRYLATDTEPERMYQNVYLLRFAPDGRCREFSEFYMQHGNE